MNKNELIALLALSNVILFGGTVTFVALWIRARERAIRAAINAKRETEGSTAEIEHLVNAVDAIAVEVERISEAQRFTTKVLIERGDVSPAKRIAAVPERVITPH